MQQLVLELAAVVTGSGQVAKVKMDINRCRFRNLWSTMPKTTHRLLMPTTAAKTPNNNTCSLMKHLVNPTLHPGSICSHPRKTPTTARTLTQRTLTRILQLLIKLEQGLAGAS